MGTHGIGNIFPISLLRASKLNPKQSQLVEVHPKCTVKRIHKMAPATDPSQQRSRFREVLFLETVLEMGHL